MVITGDNLCHDFNAILCILCAVNIAFSKYSEFGPRRACRVSQLVCDGIRVWVDSFLLNWLTCQF